MANNNPVGDVTFAAVTTFEYLLDLLTDAVNTLNPNAEGLEARVAQFTRNFFDNNPGFLPVPNRMAGYGARHHIQQGIIQLLQGRPEGEIQPGEFMDFMNTVAGQIVQNRRHVGTAPEMTTVVQVVQQQIQQMANVQAGQVGLMDAVGEVLQGAAAAAGAAGAAGAGALSSLMPRRSNTPGSTPGGMQPRMASWVAERGLEVIWRSLLQFLGNQSAVQLANDLVMNLGIPDYYADLIATALKYLAEQFPEGMSIMARAGHLLSAAVYTIMSGGTRMLTPSENTPQLPDWNNPPQGLPYSPIDLTLAPTTFWDPVLPTSPNTVLRLGGAGAGGENTGPLPPQIGGIVDADPPDAPKPPATETGVVEYDPPSSPEKDDEEEEPELPTPNMDRQQQQYETVADPTQVRILDEEDILAKQPVQLNWKRKDRDQAGDDGSGGLGHVPSAREPTSGLEPAKRHKIEDFIPPVQHIPQPKEEEQKAVQKAALSDPLSPHFPFAILGGRGVWLPFYPRTAFRFFTASDYATLSSFIRKESNTVEDPSLAGIPPSVLFERGVLLFKVMHSIFARELPVESITSEMLQVAYFLEMRQFVTAYTRYCDETTGTYLTDALQQFFQKGMRKAIHDSLSSVMSQGEGQSSANSFLPPEDSNSLLPYAKDVTPGSSLYLLASQGRSGMQNTYIPNLFFGESPFGEYDADRLSKPSPVTEPALGFPTGLSTSFF